MAGPPRTWISRRPEFVVLCMRVSFQQGPTTHRWFFDLGRRFNSGSVGIMFQKATVPGTAFHWVPQEAFFSCQHFHRRGWLSGLSVVHRMTSGRTSMRTAAALGPPGQQGPEQDVSGAPEHPEFRAVHTILHIGSFRSLCKSMRQLPNPAMKAPTSVNAQMSAISWLIGEFPAARAGRLGGVRHRPGRAGCACSPQGSAWRPRGRGRRGRNSPPPRAP